MHLHAWWALGVIGAIAALGFASGCLCYNVYASRRLEQEVAETPRDPLTGIALQAAPVALGEIGRPAVLLIHGFCSAPTDFGALPAALEAAGFRVVSPLLPGHGRTPRDLDGVTAEDLARHVLEAYERLRDESDWVAVVGNSMGGALALRLTCEAERPPDALVLSVPYLAVAHRWHYLLPGRAWNALLSPFVPYIVRPEAMPVYRQDAVRELYIYRVVSTRFVRQLFRLGDDLSRFPLQALPRRTLLLRGLGDSVVSVKAIDRLADRYGLDEGSRVVLERSDHAVFVDHDRKIAISRVTGFLVESLAKKR